MKDKIHVSLIGNPNSGKSSLFNKLTRLNQKTGNFPGVTVEKKLGICEISKLASIKSIEAEFIDLPGTYSLNPRNLNEEICIKHILNNNKKNQINLIVIDSSNIKRGLFFASQIIELNAPSIIALNMIDIAEQEGIEIDSKLLSQQLKTPIIKINARKNIGIGNLKKTIFEIANNKKFKEIKLFSKKTICSDLKFQKTKEVLSSDNNQLCINKITNYRLLKNKSEELKNIIAKINIKKIEAESHILRFKYINELYANCVKIMKNNKILKNTISIDKILIHGVYGYIIFFFILFCLFQAIFQFSAYPMDLIDQFFTKTSMIVKNNMSDNMVSNILSNGILPGLGGVIMFVPQIAILFFILSILEETGYMSRISFLMDKSMRKIGLNGKSIIPLLSGFACSIPAIMSVRNIEDKRRKFITLLIIPLMSCSARLPVYTLIISLVIPAKKIFSIISLQGVIFLFFYLLGLIVSIFIAIIIDKTMKKNENENKYILELPRYKQPDWSSVFINVLQKIKFFIVDVGKVIIFVSILIWMICSYGPEKNNGKTKYFSNNITLENSYAGIIGKKIEPIIKPLGYDWKIGISLITSFAAREVFVSTMATLYNVDNDENATLMQKMKNYKNPETNKIYFTLPVGISILMFYVFALQCMSTLAVMYKETGSWKLPALQFILFLTLAYLFSLISYQLMT